MSNLLNPEAPANQPGVQAGWAAFGPIIHRNGQHIAHIVGPGERGSIEQRTIARMIAAAPELLVALRDLLNWGRDNLSPVHNPDAHELLVAADAAVAKAEGRAA